MRVLPALKWILLTSIAVEPTFGQTGSDDRERLDAEFWDDVPDGSVVRPCAPDSRDAQVATDALRDLDARIAELAPGDAHESLTHELLDLLRTPCYRLAMEVDRLPRPDSAESLRRWWDDGGLNWLWSYIELPEKRINGTPFPQIVLPPDDRPTLSRTGHGHRFGALLCPDGDEECRAETVGWHRRAEEALERTPSSLRLEQFEPSSNFWHWESVPAFELLEEAVQKACADAPDATPNYQKFRECADGIVGRKPLLPLGAIRAPASGWLLLAGRRGHYEYCDEVSAYNLSNGEALRARHCSHLVLESDGSVDFGETERRASDDLRGGVLNVENLREAAWMLLMFPELTELRAHATYVDLPSGMERRIEKGSRGVFEVFGGASVSTAQTRLIWVIAHQDFGASGEMVWPFSYVPAEEHLARLLEIAEVSWRDGCPTAPPPASALQRLYPGVNDRDADVDTFQATVERLKGTIASWSPERCF
jgi:hypothetical protein